MNKPAQEQKESQFRKDSGSFQVDGNGESSNKKITLEVPKEEEEDDSFLDFRSPQKMRLRLESLKNPKKPLTKPKKKPKKSTDTNQPRIESSFFKATPSDLKTMEMCPLCLKPVKDETTKLNHMKSCATKNNLTTRQLMDAMELQERQAEERKAMGLISAPLVQPKKPSSSKFRKFVSDDPELHLALAISESLHEAQVIEQIEEAEVLANCSSQPLIITSEEERRKTLQNFGFTTNKPLVETANTRSRKKKLQGPTILQTRSQEEKERLLTEKIAEILTGEEAFTQLSKESQKILSQRKRLQLCSSLLKKIEKQEKKLWDRSSLISIKIDSFYVTDVSKYISPSDKNNSAYIEIYDSNEFPSKVTKENNPEKTSLETEEIEVLSKMTKSVNTRIAKWADNLNDCSFSDMLVFANNRAIWVHKLVFLVQCPNILKSVSKCEDDRFPRIQESIVWKDIEFNAALAFLEFIYCGRIQRQKQVFEDTSLMKQVNDLAKKYEVKNLLDYWREVKKENEVGKNVEKKEEKPEKKARKEVVVSPTLFDDIQVKIEEIDSSVDENEGNLDALLSVMDKDSQSQSGDGKKVVEKESVLGEKSRKVGELDSFLRAEIEERKKDLERSLVDYDTSLDGTPMRSGMLKHKNPFVKSKSIFSDSKLLSPKGPKKSALSLLEESVLRHRNDLPSTSKAPQIHYDNDDCDEIINLSFEQNSYIPEKYQIPPSNQVLDDFKIENEDIVNSSFNSTTNFQKNEKSSVNFQENQQSPTNSRISTPEHDFLNSTMNLCQKNEPSPTMSKVSTRENSPRNAELEINGNKTEENVPEDFPRDSWPEDDDCFENDDEAGKSTFSIYQKNKTDNSISKYREAWKNLKDGEDDIIVLSDDEDFVSQKENETMVSLALEGSRKRSFIPECDLVEKEVPDLSKKKRKRSGTGENGGIGVMSSPGQMYSFSDSYRSNGETVSRVSPVRPPIRNPEMDLSTPEFIRRDRELAKRNGEGSGRRKSLSPKRDNVRKFKVKAKSDLPRSGWAFPVLNPSPQKLENMRDEDLESKLEEHGLKPQQREQAIKLLKAVEKTLEIKKRTMNSPLTVSSDDDESNYKKTREKTINKGPTNINNAFKQLLLNNRDLHYKVLTYEPIELKVFLSMIKQEGLKCKKNDLMDYLDQKCITFTTERPEQRKEENVKIRS